MALSILDVLSMCPRTKDTEVTRNALSQAKREAKIMGMEDVDDYVLETFRVIMGLPTMVDAVADKSAQITNLEDPIARLSGSDQPGSEVVFIPGSELVKEGTMRRYVPLYEAKKVVSKKDLIPTYDKSFESKGENSDEAWIVDGQYYDLGDLSHEDYIVSYIIDKYKMTGVIFDPDESSAKLKYLRQIPDKKLSQEEKLVRDDKMDPRDYGLKFLGWVRFRIGGGGKNGDFTVYHLTQRKMDEIASNAKSDQKYDLWVSSSKKLYTDIPGEVLREGDIMSLAKYEERGGR